MSTYIICQEMFASRWAICVYAVRHCQRIVYPQVDHGDGFVEIAGRRHHFKMASFANDSDFLKNFQEVKEWVEEDNAEIERELSQDAKHAAE